MRSQLSRNKLFHFFLSFTLLTAAGFQSLNADDKETENAKATIAGKWIRYNGGTFETLEFKDGTETYTHHNEYGSLNTSFASDLKLSVEGGIVRFTKSNFRKTDPELAKKQGVFHNWQGSIDELGIWSRALTDNEVAGLWNDGQGSAITAPANNSLGKQLIGYWPFDGNLVEKTGTGRNGTGVNNPGFATGKLGKALKLDGLTQYVQLGGKPSDYEPTDGTISISIWCQVDDLDTIWQSLISKGQGNSWRIHRHWQQNRLSSAGLRVLRNPVPIDDNKFHHVVAVMESGKQTTFYIDNHKVIQPTQNSLGRNRRLPTVGADLLWTIHEGGYIVFNNQLRGLYSNANNLSRPYRRTTHPQEALLIASREGDLDAAMKALEAGAEVDGVSPNSYTALGYASAGGHLDLMKQLLAKGANVNLKTRFGKTPLLLVAGTNHLKAADLLFAKKSDLEANSDHGGNSAHEAIFWQQPEMLDHLLKGGVDVNGRANNKTTPLHWAVTFMNPYNPTKNKVMQECIKVLLAHKADTSLKGGNGKTAAQIAEEKGFEDIAKLLK